MVSYVETKPTILVDQTLAPSFVMYDTENNILNRSITLSLFMHNSVIGDDVYEFSINS